SPRPASQDGRLNGFSTFQLRRPLLLALKNLLCSSMASMVTAPSPSRSDPPPSFAVFVVVFGASPLELPKPPDDSPLAIVQPSTAVCRSFTFTAVCSSAFGVFRLYSLSLWQFEGFISLYVFYISQGYISIFSLIGVEFRRLLYHISC
ncbi:unnamed protein product, partial [Brassica oleracea]